jgi:hypothetical protein
VIAADPIFSQWEVSSQAPAPPLAYVVMEPPGQPYSGLVTGRNTIHWGWDEGATHSDPRSRLLFFHELGHVYDFTVLSQKKRDRIARLFHFPTFLWRPYFTEKFAMGYSFCAAGAYPIPGWWGYGYSPAPWKQHRLCRLLEGTNDGRMDSSRGERAPLSR